MSLKTKITEQLTTPLDPTYILLPNNWYLADVSALPDALAVPGPSPGLDYQCPVGDH